MSKPFRPPTIEETGLRAWIDIHREQQNNFGWKEFDLFCRLRGGKGLPDTVIADLMKKSPRTIFDWRKRREALLETEGKG